VGRVAGTYLAWELCSNESKGALTRLCGRVLSLPTLPQADPLRTPTVGVRALA